MRLHSMSLTAFGPYVGTETIDFDDLARDGLFLFTGPTGAGKTTILDAVAFALYGQLPGSRRNLLAKIRSDYADISVAPQVILECTVAGERIRIKRSPAYERPSKRGAGTATERPAVALETLVDGAWQGLENGNREVVVAEWIQERIGLTCEQFMQVVLLPQGEFAKFLQATDSDREYLLRSLFDASRFADIETWFDNREKQERAVVQKHDSGLLELRAQASAVAGIDQSEVPEDAGIEWFASLVDQFKMERGDLTAQAEEAEKASDVAQAILLGAEKVLELQRKLKSARELRKQIDAQLERMEDQRRRLTLARKATSVVPLLERLEEVEGAQLDASELLQKSTSALFERRPDASVNSPLEMSTAAAGLRKELGALEEALANETQLPEYEAKVAESITNVEDATAVVEEISKRQKALPAQIKDAGTRVTELSVLAGREEAAEQGIKTVAGAAAAARETLTLQERLGKLAQFEAEAKKAALDAKETWLLLRERRLDGMAAELAGALVVGDACAVCGSLEHPRPALAVADTPTKNDEQIAQKTSEDADLSYSEAMAARGTLEKKLAGVVAKTGGRSLDELTDELQAAKKRLADAVAAGTALAQAGRDRESLEKQLADANALLDEAVENLDAHRTAHQGASQELEQRQQRVAVARGGFDTVAERADDLTTLAKAHDEVIGALAAVSQADKDVQSCHKALTSAAKKAGFDSAEAAADAALDSAELISLAAAIEKFDKETTQAQTLLDNPDFAGLSEEAPPIDALSAGRNAAKTELQRVHAALTEAAKAYRSLRDVHKKAVAAMTDTEQARSRYAVVRDLASVIRGQGANSKAMHLTAYFLAARLEQVAEVASVRLLKMSKGRYSLVHSDERLKKRGAGGLGLQVMDAHTGVPRPTQSLSGGESFLASLALALGLAEVVTQEAGANTLDSLFVDEGFGSLDSDTLEQAMSVLDELRSGGRTIGLISHVEELKARITNQLVVVRGDRGSHVTVAA